MEVKERIKKIIKEDNIEMLTKYKDSTLSNIFVSILQDELSSFSYNNDVDIDYLYTVIKLLPKHIPSSNIGQLDEKLKAIQQQIKVFIVQKPGYVDKTNHNYKLFKNIIDEIELMQISIFYDYVEKYQGSKYQLIDYIIFELKNISKFNEALNRFPFLVNYFDQNDTNLIVSVTNAYIKKVMELDDLDDIKDILYFDKIISSIIKSKEFRFDVIDKQTILKKIRDSFSDLNGDKERKIFYLNDLREKINGNEQKKSESYINYKFGINTVFNEAINSEVRRIEDSYSMSKDRKIIDDYILSFDGEDTKEIDDALSIKVLDNNNILLGVHIADPLAFIDENSIIYEEACSRTTSIYLCDKTIPMYPKELSTDLMSLKEKNYRPAISYYFEFNENGNVVDYYFLKTIIKVNRNLTYDDFNHILNMKNNDQLKKTINYLSLVSDILQSYYNIDPLYQKVNRESSNITNTNIIGKTRGEKTVESAMIFTNYKVADHFFINGLPFSYRNHNIDPEEQATLDALKLKILQEKDNSAYLKFIEILKNIYPKAYYSTECKGHFGIHVRAYTHITSPIRRIKDNDGRICLEKFYFNSYNDDTIKYVNKLLLKNDDKANNRRSVEEEYICEYERLRKEL